MKKPIFSNTLLAVFIFFLMGAANSYALTKKQRFDRCKRDCVGSQILSEDYCDNICACMVYGGGTIDECRQEFGD